MQLRAFVLLRAPSGQWSVAVCRDLDGVMTAWRARGSDDVGILHLGFDRPPSAAFDDITQGFAGRMLLTAAARFGLTKGYEIHDSAVGEVDGMPLYLGMRGFGYSVEPEEVAATPSVAIPRNDQEASGWVAQFLSENPDQGPALALAGIADDESYLARESQLDRSLRHTLGRFRFHHLIGSDDSDPARVARCAPPWLQSLPVTALPLTVRIANVCKREQVETVGDLARFEPNLLLTTTNFGRTSFHGLRSILLDALAKGPTTEEDGYIAAEAVTMLAGMRATLAKLPDRERDILVRRMGLYAPAETLAQIGEAYGVSRERIRQIEAKLVKQIIVKDRWDNLLSRKLEALLDDRQHPLPVIGVEAVDPWFEGIAVTGDALSYILENMCGDAFHVLDIDDVPYFARIDAQQWLGSQREARALLKANAGAGWDEAQCRAMVATVLDIGAREFAGLLWDIVGPECHFTDDGDARLFTSFGKSVEAVVEAVLSEASAPMHYSDIAAAVAQRTDRDIDIRRIHSAAQNIGYLFGRGRYGLDRHCAVDQETRAVVRETIERLVCEGPIGRQWTCGEMVALLADEGIEDEDLDKYAIDLILRSSSSLACLGRLTWIARQDGVNQVRTDIRQAIAAILREADGPLTTADIATRLAEVRGTDQALAIWNFDPVVRVERGLWGLNDRDVPISREQQAILFDHLADLLAAHGVGLHVSEVFDRHPEIRRFSVDADLLCALAAHSSRLRVSGERYFYLPEWGDARREGVERILEAIMREYGAPMPFDAIVQAVDHRARRTIERGRLSALLQRLGDYDAATARWSLAAAGDDDDQAEEQGEDPVALRA